MSEDQTEEQKSAHAIEFIPLSGRQFPRYSAIKTFFRLPYIDLLNYSAQKSVPTPHFDIALMGIPFDGGVSYRPGGRFAPSKVRETSSLGRGFHLSRGLSLFKKVKIADIGDCSTVPLDLSTTHKLIEEAATKALNSGRKVVSCGGDHSTTLPMLRAYRKKYGRPLGLVHFDAHLDTYPAAWGIEVHHGSFLRHAVEEGLVDPTKVIQLGIRGPLAGGDDLDFVKKHKFNLFTVDDIRAVPLNQFTKQIPTWKNTPTYISFDVDCLDPAYAPGTGTPVPGGLTSYEVQKIFQALTCGPIVGGDIVEVSPPYDHADITSLVAVDAMFEILCLIAGNN